MRLDAGAVEAEADDLLADRFLLPMGPPAARERRFWNSGGTGAWTADQLPSRFGRARHLRSFSMTYSTALTKMMFGGRAFPR